jgi:hypothetical protein
MATKNLSLEVNEVNMVNVLGGIGVPFLMEIKAIFYGAKGLGVPLKAFTTFTTFTMQKRRKRRLWQ